MKELLKLRYLFLAGCVYLLHGKVVTNNYNHPEDLTWEKIDELYQQIQQEVDHLDVNQALANPRAFLTLCAAFDVDSAMIQQLLNAPQPDDAPIFGALPENNSLVCSKDCNAVIAAAVFGKLSNLQLLFESQQFMAEDFNDAVMSAAAFGHLDILQYLVASGVSLFAQPRYRRNPLYAACINGQTKIIDFLLKQNPPEIFFWGYMCPHYGTIFGCESGASPLGLECLELFENYKTSLMYGRIGSAIYNNDMQTLQILLKDQQGKNVIFGNVEYMQWKGNSEHKIFTNNHLMTAAQESNDKAFALLLESLQKCKSADIIETLLDTLIKLPSTNLKDEWEYLHKQCCDMLNKQLSVHTGSLTLTLYDDFFNSHSAMLVKCYMMIKDNILPITKIVLTGYQERGNISDPFALIASLLENTSVTECELFFEKNKNSYHDFDGLNHFIKVLRPGIGSTLHIDKCDIHKILHIRKYEPLLMDLLNLILERNKNMAKCEKPIFKDHIYNEYAKLINQQIAAINVDVTELLKPREKFYSLAELATFKLFHIPQDHSCANDFELALHMEIDEIQDAKMLKEMEGVKCNPTVKK